MKQINWDKESFAIFILTHGRPDNVITYNTLKNIGYTGKIYIIIDNEDKKQEEYKKNFENVIVFDKLEVSKTFDQADNFEDRRAIVYARNASFEIAEKLGLKYFMQLDDDYTNFNYRIDYQDYKLKAKMINKNFDKHLYNLLNFYKSTNLKAVSFAQGGDFIGGNGGSILNSNIAKRKCMNSFLCSTERKFKFKGRINEDVNTYTHEASKGDLFLTFPHISLNQKVTQTNSGGMTDIYKANGTYIKSFYSVIFQPSSVKVSLINGPSSSRLHHNIKWKNTVPMLIRESYKKRGDK